MISLEIAVSSLTHTNSQSSNPQKLTLRFGSICSTFSISEGHAGKCLYIDMTSDQLRTLYSNYACVLLLQQERYFSLISLEKIALGDKVICQPISFLNDNRQTKYTAQFSIVSQIYNNPKIANTNKLVQRQNVLNSLKKPPIPQQSAPKSIPLQNHQDHSKKAIKSFLYGVNPKKKTQSPPHVNSDNLLTMKQELRSQKQVIKLLQTSQNKVRPVSHKALSKQIQSYAEIEDDLLDSHPPMMEFTNNSQDQHISQLKVPQIQHIQYAESVDKQTDNNLYKDRAQNHNQYTFANSNRKTSQERRRQSPTTPSQFELIKKDSKVMQPKNTGLSKTDIKNLAKKQAQSREVKNNMLIPIARGDKFQLVPLSSLKPEQIIEYVQKQRKNQAQALKNRQKQKKLQLQQRQLTQKNKKLAQLLDKKNKEKQQQKDREGQLQRRQSKEIRSSLNQEIKEEANDSQDNAEDSIQDDYLSDFESASVSNSAIKSRLSSRGPNRSHIEKQEASAVEDEYSEQFEDYSQSMMSKGKSNNKKQSVSSQISDSYQSISISQSYRK